MAAGGSPRQALAFLAGGGGMGELIGAFDWGTTSLGAATRWPQSLKTAVSILLGSPVPSFIWWGPELVQLYNDASAPLLGGDHPGALGRPAPEVWANSWPSMSPRAAAVMKEGRPSQTETLAVPIVRNGHSEERYLTMSYGPIRDGAGHVGGVFCACTDVTPRVARPCAAEVEQSEARLDLERTESALRESEERFRALVNASSYAIYRMSPDWSEMRRLDGRGFIQDVQQPIRAWLSEYIDSSDRTEVIAAIERAVSERSPFELEHRVRRTDGTLGWTLSRAVPLFDAEGEIVEWMGAASDITARKEAEQALRASEARLLLADKAKDEFLATLGHELRTPLAAIVLWGSALRSGRVPSSELGRAVEAIVESAEAQSRLIDDLLDLSRLTAGMLLLEPEPVRVADVVRAAVGVVTPTAAAKGLWLESEVGEGVGLAMLDPVRLRQVLWNLLANAIKFTPQGGSVRLSVRKIDAALDVEVSDDGEGILPELVPRLFDRFARSDTRERRQHGGLGIGLALSRQLVELQGGTIGAHSDGPGRGATFRFRLPWVVPNVTSEVPEAPPPATELAPVSLEGITVLLVEDERNTLAAMQMTLERAGAKVFPASSAVVALASLDAADVPGAVTILVSKIGLPDMSGVALVEQLATVRRSRGRPPLPACAVSAHAREEDRQRALDAGFDMYLAKPLAPERLIEAVNDLGDVARADAEHARGQSEPLSLSPQNPPALGDAAISPAR